MAKWFFALSEASLGHHDHDWVNLIKAAVRSARQNTTLQPFFIFDGQASALTAELQAMGVTVVHHRLSYYGNILQRWNELGLGDDPLRLAVIAGAYLRTDIPRIAVDLPLEDEFVLYTDCDVMFLSDPDISQIRPAFFACAPQRYPDALQDINSGVMVMNLPGLRAEIANFNHLIVQNFERFTAYDQDALAEYYAGRFDTLPLELNWKPYWGLNDAAAIVHFHGPKPEVVRRLVADPDSPMPPIWRELYLENPAAYRDYLAVWDTFGCQTPPAPTP